MSQHDTILPKLKPQTEDWIERMARFGYATRGIVYILLGGIGAQVAFGLSARNPDMEEVLAWVFQRPFGQVMLVAVIAGLLGYALWRFFQAVVDPEQRCRGIKGQGYRIFYLVSGLIYASLALTGIKLLLDGRSDGASAYRDWTAQLVPQPFGRWLVGLVGLIVIGCGLWQLHQAYTARFKRKLKLAEMSSAEDLGVLPICRFGISARGLVFCELGVLLVIAAITGDSSKVQGIGQALKLFEQMRFGAVLIGVLALGMIAFGFYNLIEARYRRIIASRGAGG